MSETEKPVRSELVLRLIDAERDIMGLERLLTSEWSVQLTCELTVVLGLYRKQKAALLAALGEEEPR